MSYNLKQVTTVYRREAVLSNARIWATFFSEAIRVLDAIGGL